MAKTKTNILTWFIKKSINIIKGNRVELMAFSNLFNNDIKRKIRNNLDYKTNCYVEL